MAETGLVRKRAVRFVRMAVLQKEEAQPKEKV